VLIDFRVGVVALILLMPISGSSTLFPHEMLGVVGLNPLNLLLAGTLCAWLVHAFAAGSTRFVPRPLLWLYIVPILVAGVIGSRHIREIAPTLLVLYQGLDFPGAARYLQEMVLKPLLLVVFWLAGRGGGGEIGAPGAVLGAGGAVDVRDGGADSGVCGALGNRARRARPQRVTRVSLAAGPARQ